MTSTRNNPGAFNPTAVRGVRGLVGNALRLVRRGHYRRAALGLGVDTANLFEARVGRGMTNRYQCSCCGHEAHRFQHVLSGDRVAWNSACPSCGSRSRHRGLAVLLPRLLAERAPTSVLHFAAEPVLRRCFADRDWRYETADLFLEDATHTGIDLQGLPFRDGSYDFVVCNHVLEHLADDGAALGEIARVLSNKGVAVLTVPGDFSRARTVVYTGDLPNGHYRDYGLDFVEKLEAHFGKVDVIDMHELDRERRPWSHAIRALDLAFVCER